MWRIVPATFVWCSDTILSNFIEQINHLTDAGIHGIITLLEASPIYLQFETDGIHVIVK